VVVIVIFLLWFKSFMNGELLIKVMTFLTTLAPLLTDYHALEH